MFQKEMYCTRCGHTGYTHRVMPGSILIELIAWCLMLLPGLIYSLWRHSASYQGCRECDSRELVSLCSPRAQRDLHAIAADIAPAAWDLPIAR